MRKIINYIDPVAHLGDKKYPIFFPFIVTFLTVVFLEILAYDVFHNPHFVDSFAILLFALYIIYFSFRAGILGGLIATSITLFYYFYIIYSRHNSGSILYSGIQTTILLGGIYITLTAIIGGLKQTIDSLLEKTANEKRQLQTIIEQLPVGIIIADKKGEIIQENKLVSQILGTKFPKNFIFGKEMLLFAESEGKKINYNEGPLFTALTKGKVIEKEYIVKRKDKKQVHLLVNASPIFDIKGNIFAAAQIINDITERKEQERRKDDFIDMASHELKTPLTSASVFAQILQKKFKKIKDKDTRKYIKKMNLQLIKLSDLVKDLLDATRLNKGTLVVKKEKTSLKEIAEELIEDIQPTTEHTINFVCNTSGFVYADKERMRQVLTNLLTNAIKYSNENQSIDIKIKKEKNKILSSVQDYGLGISQEHQKRIFDRFYQVHDHKTYPGLGLGLYISKEIVKRHMGKMWVESQKGKGSIFYFSLPSYK